MIPLLQCPACKESCKAMPPWPPEDGIPFYHWEDGTEGVCSCGATVVVVVDEEQTPSLVARMTEARALAFARARYGRNWGYVWEDYGEPPMKCVGFAPSHSGPIHAKRTLRGWGPTWEAAIEMIEENDAKQLEESDLP